MQESLKLRRVKRFIQNKRAFYSLIIFSLIFIASMCAELITNDKPLFVKFENKLYFPIFKKYPETLFGGDFETEADYKDSYVIKLIEAKGFMIMPLFAYNYDTINYHLDTPPPTAPNKKNILGTDDQARDIFARLLYGMRVSLLFGLVLTLLSSVLGITIGAVQGYFGGLTDLIMQRFIEIWAGLPMLFILIILANFISPNFWWLLFIMLLFRWMSLVAPVRAEFLKGRKQDYVLAATIAGVPQKRIIRKHILPNALVAAFSIIPFMLSGSIVLLTSLDFLGFGLPPGTASIGELLAQGKNNLSSPWIGLTVFFTLSTILTLLIFIGEGVRDVFNTES